MAAANPAPVSDQKKRAFEALERRFAGTRPELLREVHDKTKKTKPNPKRDVDSKRTSLSFSNQASPSWKTPGISSDAEAHPVYCELPGKLHENLLRAGAMDSNRKDVVHKVVHDIIQKGEEGGKFARGAKTLKMDNWVLLDNFVAKGDGLKDARSKALVSHSKRSRKHMSMKQHRKCGSFDLPKEFHNFDLFKPMHEMWKEYIFKLTKENGKKQLAECLITADLHGAFILVVECKVTSFKGSAGIMIRETGETLGIITEDNRFRVVPKLGSVFIFQAGSWKVTLYGDKLSLKATSKETLARQHLQHLLTR
ncbi:ribonuclease MRP protein subunit POP4 isoform X1 [Typha latifolia]|uniref:ribonuclease MRP protein subunit POP4 isoform X1 n=1 Tax=Typha latifolia TaxID=4733 RepID=UPI003C2C464A